MRHGPRDRRRAPWGSVLLALSALGGLGPWACLGGGPYDDAHSAPIGVPDSVDPSSLAPLPTRINFVSSADRNLCLMPQPGQDVAAGQVVGTAPCTGDARDRWRLNAEGTLGFDETLCLSSRTPAVTEGAGLSLETCDAPTTLTVSLAGGRLLVAARGQPPAALALSVGASPADARQFVPAVVTALDVTATGLSQALIAAWASLGPAGNANVVLTGFPIVMQTAPTMCLTARSTMVGVALCNGSASQAWLVNETGGLQVGAYCLTAGTPGTLSQGTFGLLTLCRLGAEGQAYQIRAGAIGVAGLFLGPTVNPPPPAGFTATALLNVPTLWQLGGL